jgi:hypothetical protein
MGDLAYTRPPFCQLPKYVIFWMEPDLLGATMGLRQNDGDERDERKERRRPGGSCE